MCVSEIGSQARADWSAQDILAKWHSELRNVLQSEPSDTPRVVDCLRPFPVSSSTFEVIYHIYIICPSGGLKNVFARNHTVGFRGFVQPHIGENASFKCFNNYIRH